MAKNKSPAKADPRTSTAEERTKLFAEEMEKRQKTMADSNREFNRIMERYTSSRTDVKSVEEQKQILVGLSESRKKHKDERKLEITQLVNEDPVLKVERQMELADILAAFLAACNKRIESPTFVKPGNKDIHAKLKESVPEKPVNLELTPKRMAPFAEPSCSESTYAWKFTDNQPYALACTDGIDLNRTFLRFTNNEPFYSEQCGDGMLDFFTVEGGRKFAVSRKTFEVHEVEFLTKTKDQANQSRDLKFKRINEDDHVYAAKDGIYVNNRFIEYVVPCPITDILAMVDAEGVQFAVYHATGNRYFAVAKTLSRLAYPSFEIAFYQED
jgi:hypothetical protein